MTRDRNWGIQLGSANIWYIALVALAASIAFAYLRLTAGTVEIAAACLALVALLTGVLTYRSRTAFTWLWERITFRRKSSADIDVFSTTGASGLAWDGSCSNVYVEVLPQPYEVTVVGNEQESTIRELPIDAVRQLLSQFDIECHHVSVMTVAHKYDQPSPISTTVHAAHGAVGAMLHGRTVLEVSVALDGSLDSVYARQFRDSVAVGLGRTVSIAAERIRLRLAELGWNAVLLTETEVRALHAQNAQVLDDQLKDEHWDSCGTAAMSTAVFTPARWAWTQAHYREWLKFNTHRTLQVLKLTRTRTGDHAELFIGYLSADANALNTTRATGLLREYGQQADVLTATLPGVRTEAISAVAGKTFAADEPFPISLYAGGIGTYIGHTSTRAQVFVNFAVGDDPFYLIVPAAQCQQLFLGLATTGLSIDIQIPGQEWEEFARRIGATFHRNPHADILLTNQTDPPRKTHPQQARLVWTLAEPKSARYAIVAGAAQCTLHHPKLSEPLRYSWNVSNAEEKFLTTRPRRESAPSRPTAAPTPPPPQGRPDSAGGRRPASRGMPQPPHAVPPAERRGGRHSATPPNSST
ncbi:type VII secretion protein EccE [Mycobacterium sp. CBMA 213]|uniref:Type VII secretion system protein EccE domain-containing protein n=1 Tax=Mycolicibacterium sp. CBMA 213 TaxID=1968788 RepID=A0A343VR45_9MYCO|nr:MULTISPECIES: type VII secretion protein EccE [unclassified Mycolicibacterium]AVN58369.1 hypothetical protein B5P44_p00074 [Mycolicibacterium sp. CBMA 213]MUL61033.1 type VII secretion protein EccE [Mycolicibacterium sp. CBMA 335]MUM03270.1 type VII secretion protein EccE [Mycolicibacterium sp. CBMA 213]